MADRQLANEAMKQFTKQGLEIRLGENRDALRIQLARQRRRVLAVVDVRDLRGREGDDLVPALQRIREHEGLAYQLSLDNDQAIAQSARGTASGLPENLLVLWIVFPFLKLAHEFGHAFAVKARGGEVHEMGVMIMVLTPVPYVDASSAWAFRSKWQRIMVGAAGMMVELFIASLAGGGVIDGRLAIALVLAAVFRFTCSGDPSAIFTP